jgi:hypothetical protein
MTGVKVFVAEGYKRLVGEVIDGAPKVDTP